MSDDGETTIVGEHLKVDAGVFFGEGGEVGDVAESVVLSFAGGTKNGDFEVGGQNFILHTSCLRHNPSHGFV